MYRILYSVHSVYTQQLTGEQNYELVGTGTVPGTGTKLLKLIMNKIV